VSDKVAERKEIAVSPKILALYTGIYELRPGFDLVITLEGEQLVSQATGQDKIPLFAESETKFFPKVMDAEIEFPKDDRGAVTHLMLHQGAGSSRVRRWRQRACVRLGIRCLRRRDDPLALRALRIEPENAYRQQFRHG